MQLLNRHQKYDSGTRESAGLGFVLNYTGATIELMGGNECDVENTIEEGDKINWRILKLERAMR